MYPDQSPEQKLDGISKPDPYWYHPPATSGKAIASLVSGIASFCLAALAGLPAIILAILAFRDISRSKGRLGGTGLSIAGLVLGCVGCGLTVVYLFLGYVAREAYGMQDSAQNLKRIGLAMHNHHDTYRRFPLAGIADTSKREPVMQSSSGWYGGLGLSWRVHLLPYLEQAGLYKEFNLDEPWDSAHNKKLIEHMPDVYKSPIRSIDDFKTVYVAVIATADRASAGTAFNREPRPIGMRDITDGTSNTIMIVEADAEEAVVWTKPGDVQFDPQDPRRGLGSLRPRGFLALFADGSVDLIPNSVSDETIRRLFYRNDGQLPTDYAPPSRRRGY